MRCYGLKWSKIVGLLLAAEYPARTDDAVRNRWPRLVRKQQAVAAARAEAELEAADAASSSSADASTTADVAARRRSRRSRPATLYHAPEMMGGMGNDDTALVSPAAELSMPLLENPETTGSHRPTATARCSRRRGRSSSASASASSRAARRTPRRPQRRRPPLPPPSSPRRRRRRPPPKRRWRRRSRAAAATCGRPRRTRTIDEGVRLEGLRWREVAEKLPGRTASGCRNRWVRTQERNFAADGRAVRGAVAVFAALRAEGRISKRHKWERRDHRRRGDGFRGELPSELVV